MFEIVDAINQQIPSSVKPGAMLILTKFAELLRSTKEPMKRRVSLDRFVAATHYKDKKSVGILLDELHALGYLEALEDRKKKHKGDKATLYQLHLPEGYDKQLTDLRRTRYYAGKEFHPELNDDDTDLSSPLHKDISATASPVSVCQAGEIPAADGIFPVEAGENPKPKGETPPQNKVKTKKENNNTERSAVVDDLEEVRNAKRALADATGASLGTFSAFGITKKNAQYVYEAIDTFNSAVNAGKDINNPVGYIRSIFQNFCESGGSAKCMGKIQSSEEKKLKDEEAAKDHIRMRWGEIRSKINLNGLPDEKRMALWDKYFKYVVSYRQSCEWVAVADKIIDVFYYKGPTDTSERQHTPEEFNSDFPDVQARAEQLRKTIDAIKSPFFNI